MTNDMSPFDDDLDLELEPDQPTEEIQRRRRDPTAPIAVSGLATSKVFMQCKQVYQTMFERSSLRGIHPNAVRVWSGYTTYLFNELKLSNPRYTDILNTLVKSGCVRQMQRGGGASQSEWELIRDITPEDFSQNYKSRTSVREDRVGQQIRDVTKVVNKQDMQISELQSDVKQIKIELQNIKDQISGS